MKPTEQQDILLRKYLRDSLRYRETYEEVYDHVLSALEHNSYTGTLEEVVNQILRDDFGGYDQLKKMEYKAKGVAIADGVQKFMVFFVDYFRWPRLLYTAGFSILIFFTIGRVKLAPITFEAIFSLIILTPAILSLRRYYVVGYLFRDKKSSIRDDVFARISMVPTRLFVFIFIGFILGINNGHNVWQNATPLVITGLYVVSFIYLLALVKLYRDEFKMNITA